MADTATEAPPKRRRGMSLRPRESQAPDAERICKRAEALLRKRANVDNLQQELADYIIPRKAVITEQRAEGEELTERVWRSVPIRANELLAARMQGALTSPSVRWFSLKTRDETINEVFAVRQWLNKVEERLYLAVRQSNFNQEMGEVYLDLGAFGIGAMLIEENPKEAPGFNGFLDVALAPGTYAIAEAAAGSVNVLYRFVTMTVAQCEEQFGLDALPPEWRELVDKEPDTEKTLIHAIEPRRVTNPKRKDSLHWPWSSVWVARQEKTILNESGYHEFPAIVPRWGKTTGEVYGRGPGHTALPDIRTLNREWELMLQQASKVIDPPGFVSSDAAIVELDQRPGMQNTVDGDPRQAWVPMESGGKLDVGNMLKNDLENEIRNTFYWDQLQLSSDRQMTLGEVQRRLEIMQQFLAPVLSRLESEGLAPMLNRKFNLMWRAGAFPPPPPELKGQELDIEYEGPLARSQKATRLAGFQQYMELMMPVWQNKPEGMDNIDADYIARDLAEVAGLPAPYLVDEKARDQVRAQRKQQQELQQKMALAQQAAETGGKLAPVMKAAQDMPQGGAGGAGGAAGSPDIEALLSQITGGQGAPA